MKHSNVVAAVIVLLAAAHCCFAGELDDKMQEITDRCFAKNEVPEDEQKRLIDAKFDVADGEPSTMCFAKCEMEEWGLMEGGVLDEASLTEKFAPYLGEEKMAELIEKCRNERGDAPCETEFKMFTCFHREAGVDF